MMNREPFPSTYPRLCRAGSGTGAWGPYEIDGAEMKPRLESLAMDVVGGTPAEFAAHQAEETRRWAALIRRRGIRLE
jgi:hypothetical protein